MARAKQKANARICELIANGETVSQDRRNAILGGIVSARNRIGLRAWGVRMRGLRAAKAAHRVIRASGRTPGEEGRAALAAKRALRQAQDGAAKRASARNTGIHIDTAPERTANTLDD